MPARRELFPHVLEMNHQARRRLGCCVYLVHDQGQWLLIDIGYEDTVAEIIDMIRRMDFSLSHCRYLVATHADVDHIQGLKKAKDLLPSAETVGHPETRRLLLEGDRVMTYAEISAQQISIDLPIIKLDRTIDEGDVLKLGDKTLEVWHTPGHTHGQLSFRMDELLFCGDNIYRDGCVGNIDAHHGSDIPAFIRSLERIRNSDVEWLLPSHGPIFRKDNALLDSTIERLNGYQHMADFGTCAVDWPLLTSGTKSWLAATFPRRLNKARLESGLRLIVAAGIVCSDYTASTRVGIAPQDWGLGTVWLHGR
ncbi:MAG TPA: MBL fold metallo-hydrolase [Planctomycetaceae bacterium]|nr:MBL fold metallo-hydrolase [Planctomycetaceae bacterium]